MGRKLSFLGNQSRKVDLVYRMRDGAVLRKSNMIRYCESFTRWLLCEEDILAPPPPLNTKSSSKCDYNGYGLSVPTTCELPYVLACIHRMTKHYKFLPRSKNFGQKFKNNNWSDSIRATNKKCFNIMTQRNSMRCFFLPKTLEKRRMIIKIQC